MKAASEVCRKSLPTCSDEETKRNKFEKAKKQYPKIKGNKDVFCWTCHKSGNVATCSRCPRAYHLKCGHLDKVPEPSKKWVCPECDIVQRANIQWSNVQVKVLSQLLGYVIERMKLVRGSEDFCEPVDTNKWHDYLDYVIKPMDIPKLVNNVRRHLYKSTEAFLADFRWIVHDSYVYNSVHSAYTKTAKSMSAVAKQECEEIKNCADCYLHAYSLEESSWFIEPCTTPHVLVWAQLSGFPYWPGKVMKQSGDLIDVRFFGDHSRANVPVTSCFLYSRLMPCTVKKTHPKIADGVKEAEEHVKKLRSLYGTFYYAQYRVRYVPKDEDLIRKLQLPGFRRPNETQEFLKMVEQERATKMIIDRDFQCEMKQMYTQKKTLVPTKRKSVEQSPREGPKRMLVQLNTPMGPKCAVMNWSGSESDSSPKHVPEQMAENAKSGSLNSSLSSLLEPVPTKRLRLSERLLPQKVTEPENEAMIKQVVATSTKELVDIYKSISPNKPKTPIKDTGILESMSRKLLTPTSAKSVEVNEDSPSHTTSSEEKRIVSPSVQPRQNGFKNSLEGLTSHSQEDLDIDSDVDALVIASRESSPVRNANDKELGNENSLLKTTLPPGSGNGVRDCVAGNVEGKFGASESVSCILDSVSASPKVHGRCDANVLDGAGGKCSMEIVSEKSEHCEPKNPILHDEEVGCTTNDSTKDVIVTESLSDKMDEVGLEGNVCQEAPSTGAIDIRSKSSDAPLEKDDYQVLDSSISYNTSEVKSVDAKANDSGRSDILDLLDGDLSHLYDNLASLNSQSNDFITNDTNATLETGRLEQSNLELRDVSVLGSNIQIHDSVDVSKEPESKAISSFSSTGSSLNMKFSLDSDANEVKSVSHDSVDVSKEPESEAISSFSSTGSSLNMKVSHDSDANEVKSVSHDSVDVSKEPESEAISSFSSTGSSLNMKVSHDSDANEVKSVKSHDTLRLGKESPQSHLKEALISSALGNAGSSCQIDASNNAFETVGSKSVEIQICDSSSEATSSSNHLAITCTEERTKPRLSSDESGVGLETERTWTSNDREPCMLPSSDLTVQNELLRVKPLLALQSEPPKINQGSVPGEDQFSKDSDVATFRDSQKDLINASNSTNSLEMDVEPVETGKMKSVEIRKPPTVIAFTNAISLEKTLKQRSSERKEKSVNPGSVGGEDGQVDANSSSPLVVGKVAETSLVTSSPDSKEYQVIANSALVMAPVGSEQEQDGNFVTIASSMSLSHLSASTSARTQPVKLKDPAQIKKMVGDGDVKKSKLKEDNKDVVASGMPRPIVIKLESEGGDDVLDSPSAPAVKTTKPSIKVVHLSNLMEHPRLADVKRDCGTPKNNMIPPFNPKRNMSDVRALIEAKKQFISAKLKGDIYEMLDEIKAEYDAHIELLTSVSDRYLQHFENTFETDKTKLYEDFKHKLRDQMDQQITEIKRKQWCANCGAEASFHCCWNHAYCGDECQKEDWATHTQVCTQYSMSATDPFIRVSPTFQTLLEKQNTYGVPKKISVADLINVPVAVSVQNSPPKLQIKKPKKLLGPTTYSQVPTISIPDSELPALPRPPPSAKSYLTAPVQRLNNGEQISFDNGSRAYRIIQNPVPQKSLKVVGNSSRNPTSLNTYAGPLMRLGGQNRSFALVVGGDTPKGSSSTYGNIKKNYSPHPSTSGTLASKLANKTVTLTKKIAPAPVAKKSPTVRVMEENELATILNRNHLRDAYAHASS